jgi:hypothetical protein
MNKKLIILIIPLFILALIILSRYANTLSITQFGGSFTINGNSLSPQTINSRTAEVYCSITTDLTAGNTMNVFIEIIAQGVPGTTLEHIAISGIGSSGGSVSVTRNLIIGENRIYCVIYRKASNGVRYDVTESQIIINYPYTKHSLYTCFNNNIYWYDNQGLINDLKESCDDSNSCTTDLCIGSTCNHENKELINQYCNNNVFYTNGKCNAQTGLNEYTQTECKNYCNNLEFNRYLYCDNTNGCTYTKTSCNDNNACTTDSCNIDGCINEPITPCCGNGKCETGELFTNCENDCSNKCLNKNVNNYCNGIDFNYDLQCNPNNGLITSTNKSCNDSNACTTDSCNIDGCINEARIIDCSPKCINAIWYYTQGYCNTLSGECSYDLTKECQYSCNSEGDACNDEPLNINEQLMTIPLWIYGVIISLIISILYLVLKAKK